VSCDGLGNIAESVELLIGENVYKKAPYLYKVLWGGSLNRLKAGLGQHYVEATSVTIARFPPDHASRLHPRDLM
jgi:hypothetical protein